MNTIQATAIRVMGAAAIAASIILPNLPSQPHPVEVFSITHHTPLEPIAYLPIPDSQVRRDQLTDKVISTYNIDRDLAIRIVNSTLLYENDVFTAEDLLAIIAIESSFRPTVYSNLKSDPAYGLMQVRLGVWENIVDAEKVKRVRYQIKYGAHILNEYYNRSGSKHGAIQAYNVGITAFMKGKRAPTYLSRYQHSLKLFS